MARVTPLRYAGLALCVGLALGGARLSGGSLVGGTASLAVHVVDAAGRPVPGVWVTAMLSTGGPVKGVATNSDGFGRFEDLLDGIYRIDFDLLGFDITRHNHVSVSGSAEAEVNAIL